MHTLHDRLAALGDEGVDDRPRPAPAEVWRSGVRYQRRRRAGTLAIVAVAVALVAAISTTGWLRSSAEVRPAGPSGPVLGIPDRLYEPSRWLPGTDDDGPLGVLALVKVYDRGDWSWHGSHVALVGVSASTGEYRFLDLPDAASHQLDDAALSADGSRLAYWTTGATTASPNTESGQTEPVVGVAVYDTTTGAVSRLDLPSAHGLNPDGLAWVDDEVLFEAGRYRGGDGDDPMLQGSSTTSTARTWRPGDPASVRADRELLSRGIRMSLGDRARPLNPSGTRVAYTPGSRIPNHVYVAPRPAGSGPPHGLPHTSETLQVFGWSDDDHVVLEKRVWPKHSGHISSEIDVVDVRDGTSRTLTRGDDLGSVQASYADDLFARPSVPAVEPPRPLDPRWVAGLSITVVVLAIAALVGWRRRAQP